MPPDEPTASTGDPPAPSPRAERDATADPMPGATVAGRYRVLGVLGEGGFGLVYEAEQVAPVRRRVALKVLKPGMDSRAILARFEAERQALAVMDHPCVAKVLDAGETGRGLPFFVMELVRGSPITDYCDRQRLTIAQRLGLFAQVCDAIQHAHTKAIIHRDIKPSNILVEVRESGEATPKVIDFGIAKAMAQKLTERTLFTERGQLIGTPAYMSPEQAEMGAEDIDTRSDVYSLGILLYELLTGETPFDLRAAAFVEIQRVIREQEPPKPSARLTGLSESASRIAEQRRTDLRSLSGTLRRELEWIPLKALRKDRTERYRTAADLADDIRRYLAGEALEAGPPSVAYRLRKFVRRNKGPVAAVLALFAVLLLGITATSLALGIAFRQAKRADEAYQDAMLAKATQTVLTAQFREERDAAESARRVLEYNSYISNIQIAGEYFANRRYAGVFERLAACPPHLRGWEWHALSARVDPSLIQLAGHTDVVWSASFSPDGTRIVTASWDGTARVWDAATGETVAELTHSAGVVSASFSPDGTRIVTASDDGAAHVWDATTGEALAELTGHTDPVRSASFSPDGTRIVTASWDGTARVWDAATGETVAELTGHTGPVNSASYSPDGTRIVSASRDGTVWVWNAATTEMEVELTGHMGGVESASFSPDGTRIVSASRDGAARVWDASTGDPLAELTHPAMVASASFNADGTRIVTAAGDGAARVWDASTGDPLAELTHPAVVGSATFNPESTRIVTASWDGTARVWDTATGEIVAELAGQTSAVMSASYSPDGTRIVSASRDGTVWVWNAATTEMEVELTGHMGGVESASFSPDGTRIVSASRDGTARVWDAATGETVAELTGHTGQVNSASYSPDGTRIVTASIDGTARVWDAATGDTVGGLTGHTAQVNSASFSPDGTRIVTASIDSTARIWDASTGASLAELRGHTGALRSASFSPDGTRIVTASDDGTVRVRDAVPYRIRYAERQANARGEDGSAIVRAWMDEVGFPKPVVAGP